MVVGGKVAAFPAGVASAAAEDPDRIDLAIELPINRLHPFDHLGRPGCPPAILQPQGLDLLEAIESAAIDAGAFPGRAFPLLGAPQVPRPKWPGPALVGPHGVDTATPARSDLFEKDTVVADRPLADAGPRPVTVRYRACNPLTDKSRCSASISISGLLIQIYPSSGPRSSFRTAYTRNAAHRYTTPSRWPRLTLSIPDNHDSQEGIVRKIDPAFNVGHGDGTASRTSE